NAAVKALLRQARKRSCVAHRKEAGWWEALVELVGLEDVTAPAGARAELLLMSCQVLLKGGRFGLGSWAAEGGIAIAGCGNETVLLRRAHTVLGALYSRVRRIDHAIAQYLLAFELAEHLGDALGKCSTISNLAGALWRVGLYEDSIALSEYAIE